MARPDRKRTLFLVVHRGEVGLEEYHATIHRDGTVVCNRPWDAHDQCVRNFNSLSVSVVFEGCFCAGLRAKHGVPTPEQLSEGAKLFALLRKRYPEAKVTGHSELGQGATYDVSKLGPLLDCPGSRFGLEIFKRDVEVLVELRQRPVVVDGQVPVVKLG